MNSRQSLEFAIKLARSAAYVADRCEPIRPAAMNRLLRVFQRRTDRWHSALDREYATSAIAVLEEIFATEPLTRVWTALLAAIDDLSPQASHRPLAEHLLNGHVAVKRGALELLVDPVRVPPHEALSLDRLRRNADTWSDLLVGHLAIDYDVSEFAVDSIRARQVTSDHGPDGPLASHSAWRIVAASVRGSFRPSPGTIGPNAALNARIATAILACCRTAYPLDKAYQPLPRVAV
ncbi:MAG TPA: hypothetical protein VG713_16790 [Pirellulales bacterium]|nr:hypothetical protein [Pirellulales bacterium]